MTVTGNGPHTNETGAKAVSAQAGNVTAVNIVTTRSTDAWQGFYGNVTGRIVLDDASNNTMYDWTLPDPSGEIYAVNSSDSVAWANVYCFNSSGLRNASGSNTNPNNVVYNFNLTNLEAKWGINETDRDGINETFNDTYMDTTGFLVGNVRFDRADGCSITHPYTNDNYSSTNYTEFLMSDNASLIFTSLLTENANDYQSANNSNSDNSTADFEMIVLQDGHAKSTQVSLPYYFYVELS